MSATALSGGWAKVTTVKCDTCGTERKFTGTTNRRECRYTLEICGWLFSKPDRDICPDCQKKEAE